MSHSDGLVPEITLPENAAQDPAAVSLDGRRFQFAGSLRSAFEPGAFVTLLGADGTRQLGQVEEVTFSVGGDMQGAGRILGVISGSTGRLDQHFSAPFDASVVLPADAPTIAALYERTGNVLDIGSYLASSDLPAYLLPHRFNRHTFWCGQSGSGKTYALGVVLEQILLHTALPMVIFDPNGDFVRLREPRQAAGETADTRTIRERNIRVLRPSSPDPDSLRVRFIDLPLRAKAAVMHLHPLENREEYRELIHLEEMTGSTDGEDVVPRLLQSREAAAVALAARIENLGLLDWNVWAGHFETVTDILETRPDATVLDLGGFDNPDESLVVAMAVLDDLWARREQRRPLLIVIDEAHNLASPEQHSPLHVAVRERLVQIAAEGRKYGLWLLLSTQRPSRIHPSIISQCDNLALMKMTSPLDLDQLATIFGFVPPAMLARAARFAQGEALFAGGFTSAPTIVRIGDRLTEEGGSDVGVPTRGE